MVADSKQVEIAYKEISARPGRARYLVVLLHGLGTNAGFMNSLGVLVSEHCPDARVLMLEGIEPYAPPGQGEGNHFELPRFLRGTTGADNRRQWFTIDGDWQAMRTGVLRAAGRVNSFLNAERDRMGIADRNIALMGFSQGGGVALVTAYSRPQTIACVVGHSTIFVDDPSFASRPETLFLYGDADEEFSTQRYAGVVANLQDYLQGALSVVAVPDLSHKTSAQTRAVTAEFIARHLKTS